MAPELFLPDFLQQHVTETLVKWSTVRQECSELQHVTCKSVRKNRSKWNQVFHDPKTASLLKKSDLIIKTIKTNFMRLMEIFFIIKFSFFVLYLIICDLNSLLCSIQRTFSPLSPSISTDAVCILFLHISASSNKSWNQILNDPQCLA